MSTSVHAAPAQGSAAARSSREARAAVGAVRDRTDGFPSRKTLSTRERVTALAVAEAMFAEDGEVEKAALHAHVAEVDALISAASRPTRFGLRLALFVVRVAPLLLFAHFTTLERLPVKERVAVLSQMERSPFAALSLAFIGWRSVMTLVYYESTRELAQLGYSDERSRYKRHLALTGENVIPAPAESGVRLRDPTSEASQTSTKEVA